VASTPLELTEVPALIGVLADALGDSIDVGSESATPRPGFLAGLRAWLWPRLAQVTELRLVRETSDQQKVG
jgi:hypothetical protein